ncbi:hypothetical protein GCM10023328_05180 [Modestobacter marinus]|uniref:Fibronectin type-III domain-containing protein n=1 Tax=Modestobacter marinus TaxID=477641 RepID=A0A846LXH3_9ACTN|nr:hypothetical protein [Modestobacter marinus]NIH67060.1 hypothetical protein [Modestobacter marinus]GGL51722.1 hypothetical protein GCM10011589_04780 [Modestobacter marinus]
MAEQGRRTTGGRPVAQRRAPARRAPVRRGSRVRRRRDHTRWLVPLLAVTVGAVVLAPQVTPALVDLTASTSPAVTPVVRGPAAVPAQAPVLAEAQGVDTLADVAAARTEAVSRAGAASRADVATDGGLTVPQPPRPGRISIVPNASVGRPPVYTLRPDGCGGAGTTPRRIVPGVVPGPGSATLDWMSDNRPEVVGYRVQAVSQRLVGGQQPPPVVRAVDQVEGCVPMTVTVDGLTPGEPYVFWFEEQVTSASTGVTRLVQVGTTDAVVIG